MKWKCKCGKKYELTSDCGDYHFKNKKLWEYSDIFHFVCSCGRKRTIKIGF